MTEKLAYSINELAEAADLGRSLIYEEMKAGHLPAFKVGTRTIILADDAKRWLRSRPSKATNFSRPQVLPEESV